MGKGILNRGTQVHKSKVKYNRLTVAKKFDCNVVKYKTEEQQKSHLDPYCDHCGRKTLHIYIHGHYQCSTCKVVSDPCCSGDQNVDKGDSKRLSQKQKEQWRGYVSSKLEPVDDQENIRRVKNEVDLWLKETRVPKKLQNKLQRQASEKGLEGSQVDKYIQKVERRMNRRKSD